MSLQEVQRAVEEALGLAEEEADVEGGIEDIDMAEEVKKGDMGEEEGGWLGSACKQTADCSECPILNWAVMTLVLL